MVNTARLLDDFNKVRASPPHDGCTVQIEESNILRWEAKIAGPENSVWEGGIFTLDLIFPENYPASPPTVKFRDYMYHPNVHRNIGTVCMEMLHGENWDPEYNVYTILTHVQLLLKTPNTGSPANGHAAATYLKNRPAYEEKARQIVNSSKLGL